MRTFFIVLLLLCIYAGKSQVVYMKNTTGSPLYIRNVNQYLKGSFPMVIPAGKELTLPYGDTPFFLNLSFGQGRQTDFLISGPDSLQFRKDASLLIPVPVSRKTAANTLFNISVGLVSAGTWMGDYDYLREMPKEAGKRDIFLGELYRKRLQALNEYVKDHTVSGDVTGLFKKLLWSRWMTSLIGITSREEEIPQQIALNKKQLAAVIDSFNCGSCTGVLEYKRAAWYTFMQFFLQEKRKTVQTGFALTDQYFPEKQINRFLKAKILYDSLLADPLRAYVYDPSFMQELPSEYLQPLQDLLRLHKGTREGLDSIQVANEAGEVWSFKELIAKQAGNLVLVDCWASWCMPCRRELPQSLAHEKEFKNKKVSFIFLSTDEDPGNWKKALPVVKLAGKSNSLVLLGRSGKLFSDKYQVDAIPRYLLFDKQGNLLSYKFEQPSSPQFKEKLLQQLNE